MIAIRPFITCLEFKGFRLEPCRLSNSLWLNRMTLVHQRHPFLRPRMEQHQRCSWKLYCKSASRGGVEEFARILRSFHKRETFFFDPTASCWRRVVVTLLIDVRCGGIEFLMRHVVHFVFVLCESECGEVEVKWLWSLLLWYQLVSFLTKWKH